LRSYEIIRSFAFVPVGNPFALVNGKEGGRTEGEPKKVDSPKGEKLSLTTKGEKT